MSLSWRQLDRDDLGVPRGVYACDAIDQHASGWCGCCYLVAAAQMVRDRAHIHLARQRLRVSPFVDMQHLLDRFDGWQAQPGWNACHGGFSEHVLNCMRTDRACAHFLHVEQRLRTWFGFVTPLGRTTAHPTAALEVEVGEVTALNSEEEVRSALRDGPVILEISARTLKSIDAWGIVCDPTPRPADHAVCVVGFVEGDEWTGGRDAWILRNSWGATRAPVQLPDELACNQVGINDCEVRWETWRGDPRDPGFALLPCSLVSNPSHQSPWMTASVSVSKKK